MTITQSNPTLDAGYLLEQLSDALLVLDRAWRLTGMNRKAEELFGSRRETLLGRMAWEVYPEGLDCGLKNHCEQAMRDGEETRFEAFLPAFGCWFELRAHPLNDGVCVFFNDISERVNSEHRYRALVENAPDGISLLDRDGTLIYESPGYQRILGYEPGHALGNRRDDLVHPEDRARLQHNVFNLPSGESVTLEYRFMHADGEWRWLRGTFTNRLEDPAFGAYVINYKDISVERQARTDLLCKQAELERVNKQLHTRIARLAMLRRLQLAPAGRGLEACLQAMFEEAFKDMTAGARVFLKHGQSLELVTTWGSPDQQTELRARAEGTSTAHSAVEEGRIITLNGDTYRQALGSDGVTASGIFRACTAIPLVRNGGLVGAIELFSPRDLPDDEEWYAFLETFASHVAVAIENSQLMDRLERNLTDYQALAAFGERIETVHDVDELLDLGLKSLVAQLRLDFAMFSDVQDDMVRPVRLYGPVEVEMKAALMRPVCLSEGVHGQVARTGEPVVVYDYRSYQNKHPRVEQTQLTSLIALPVKQAGAVRHVIALASLGRHVRLDDNALSIASAFVRRLENALERIDYQRELKTTREATLRSLGLALEYRDYETKGHTDRVVDLALSFGRAMRFSAEQLQALTWGAYLHDLGKVAISDEILLKPGKLTDEEFATIKRHTVFGADMCREIPFLPGETRQMVRSHHERWDGQGYPDGLAGKEIPVMARMFALVDVYDALTSDRPYKNAWSHEEAVAEIRRQAGTQFDRELARVFLKLVDSLQS